MLGCCHLGLRVKLCYSGGAGGLWVASGSHTCQVWFSVGHWGPGEMCQYPQSSPSKLVGSVGGRGLKAGTQGGGVLQAAPHLQDLPPPLQEKVKERRERIVVEFEKTGLFLMEAKQRLLQALKEEEEETVAKLQKSMASLAQQGHSLEMLLLQLEDRNERTPFQMLQVGWAHLFTWLGFGWEMGA